MTDRWEYRVVHMHRFLNIEETASIFELDLNKLGQDGWEMIAMSDGYVFLKRRRSWD